MLTSKLPLTIWFLAIYLITQEKNGVSALELSRSLGISYNATWRLKHKLMQAMKERDDEVQLSGIIQLDDAYWGGARTGKVGRGAAGKRPFVAAVSLNEEGHPNLMRFSAVEGFKKKELTQWAKKHLWPSSLVVSDGLACFRGIEEANSFHLGIVTGGGPDSVKLPGVAAIFILAAILSTPLVLIAGLILNKNKVQRTIVRYGKKKIVNWGTHTFYFLPIEYWAWLIPVFTILSWAICSFV